MILRRRSRLSCVNSERPEEDEMSGKPLSITQVGRVVIPVSDHDRALEFYTGIFGLEKRMDVAFGDDNRWIEVAPKGQQTSIALSRPPAGSPSATRTATRCSSSRRRHSRSALLGSGS
jgi:hypothetical protein